MLWVEAYLLSFNLCNAKYSNFNWYIVFVSIIYFILQLHVYQNFITLDTRWKKISTTGNAHFRSIFTILQIVVSRDKFWERFISRLKLDVLTQYFVHKSLWLKNILSIRWLVIAFTNCLNSLKLNSACTPKSIHWGIFNWNTI